MHDARMDCDVAIVGGGIAGPGLAAALADSGLRVILIEKDASPPDTARGDHLQPAVLEILERWDVLDGLVARGAERRLGTRWFAADGELILDVPADDLPVPHPYFLYLNHERISAALLERAAGSPGFTLLRPAAASLIPGDDGRHRLAVRTGDDRIEIRAACIVAADGRGSRLRRALAMPTDSYDYRNPLVVLFVPRASDDPRNDLQAWCNPAGVVSLVPRLGGLWKVGLPVDRDELADWTAATPADLSARLGTLAPPLRNQTAELAGIYPVRRVDVAHWSQDNVVLLGDACHAMHPGRSQGMNISLKAAATLAECLNSALAPLATAAVPEILADYARATRTRFAPMLADNHRRGLAMDAPGAAAVDAMAEQLRAVARDPQQRRAYAMGAAGYPVEDSD